MSDLFAMSCPDAAVRRTAKQAAIRMLKDFGPHFEIHEDEIADGFILLAVNRNTPWKLVSGAGAIAAVIGLPAASTIEDEAAALLAAPGAARTCLRELCRRLNYGAALRLDADGSLLCTTDYLGIYPLFVHAGSGMTVCSSALPLFRAVPQLALHPDRGAMAASLLLAHYLFGETVYEEVARLDARAVVEIRKGVISKHDPATHHGNRADARHAVDECHELLTEVSRELLPHTRATLMSGGLDSRLLSGYLVRSALAERHRGITLGSTTDFDVQFGAKVLRHLGLEHTHVEIRHDRFLEWLGHEALWDGVQSGSYVLHFWGVARDEALHDGRLATALFGDAILGAKQVDWASDARYADYSFDTLFSANNLWGLPERIIRNLLRDRDAVERVHECRARLRAEFDACGAEPSKSAWWFQLLHRQRFLVGRFAKLLSYGSWPVMPFIDYRVREYFDALPYACVQNRALQFAIVLQKFPALARLPLDRGNSDTRSVVAGLRPSRVPWVIGQCLDAVGKSIRHRLDRVDRRFHERMFDMNAAGWLAARAHFGDVIELASARVHVPFARQMLVERVPPGRAGAIAAGSARKAAMAAICWIAMQEAPEQLARILARPRATPGLETAPPARPRIAAAVARQSSFDDR
jgi:hypothetical protein